VRVACLLVPDLPLHAELRASPDLLGHPLAITSGPGTRAEIIAASHEAGALGIRIGQTLPQARATCPDLAVRIASPVLERTARETLLDVAFSLSPRAELAPRATGPFVSEGAVYVDASGIQALHRSESRFASMLHARAERAGLGGFVALASSRETGRLAARHLAHLPTHPPARGPRAGAAETIRVLAAGDELAFLSGLPVDLLDPDDRTAQALTRFGIHRIRDLLRLPRRDLAARLGPEVLELVARARGETTGPPLPAPRDLRLEEGLDLEAPVERLEAMAFVLRGLVSRLIERLQLRALGCAELRLELRLEGGGRQSRRIGMAAPTRDERVLLRLLRLALESHPPKTAVEGVTLASEGAPLGQDQLDLFLPRGPSASELDQTLAELGSLCGSERVGAPAVVDSHRPDAYALKPFRPGRSSPPPPDTRRRGNSVGPTLRALRPPLPAEVRIEGGKPTFVRSGVSRGEVHSVAGPWRTTGDWWSESAHFAVDHYDVQMSDGTVLRLRFDWKTRRWQIDGLYD
jgi:protein ImuB